MRPTNREPSAGYSFIEMLTVIVVLSVLMVMTMLTMGPAIRHGKVRNAANVLAGDLQFAQMLAAQHRRPMSFIVATATQQYIIRDRDSASAVYRTRAMGIGSPYNLDELTASPATSVELYPNGVARQTTTMTVGLAGFQRQVRLTRAGQIRILR